MKHQWVFFFIAGVALFQLFIVKPGTSSVDFSSLSWSKNENGDVSIIDSSIISSSSSSSAVSGSKFSGNRVQTFAKALRFRNHRQSDASGAATKHPSGVTNKLWAVCTTIHPPTQAVADFAKREDWAIVVVGDEGMAPFQVEGVKTVVLEPGDQRSMGRDFPELFGQLPYRHFARKNVGYLYAILHGAELIWDFDDDNFLKPGIFPSIPDSANIRKVRFRENCSAFNPLPLMGGESKPYPMWPRGFPLPLIRHPCFVDLVHTDGSKIAVYQSLSDNEPDVDAIYRLTRKTPMQFRKDVGEGFTISLPKGTLSPYNSQATLVAKDAFWSLLLPVTVHGRVSDIWRSYVAQRLLWDVGREIAFTPPIVDQYRNAHVILADMQAETDLYMKSTALVDHLRVWNGTAPSLAGRYEELMVSLFEHGYVEEGDVLLCQEWIAALIQVGYSFSPLIGERVEHFGKRNRTQVVEDSERNNNHPAQNVSGVTEDVMP